MKYIFNIKPLPKPRMTAGDRSGYRKCVRDYWDYKKELINQANKLGYKLPDILEDVTFCLPMPVSWSQKKKILMDGKPHQQTPDIDNLIKALFDSLTNSDANIHTLKNIRKIWGLEGQIVEYIYY